LNTSNEFRYWRCPRPTYRDGRRSHPDGWSGKTRRDYERSRNRRTNIYEDDRIIISGRWFARAPTFAKATTAADISLSTPGRSSRYHSAAETDRTRNSVLFANNTRAIKCPLFASSVFVFYAVRALSKNRLIAQMSRNGIVRRTCNDGGKRKRQGRTWMIVVVVTRTPTRGRGTRPEKLVGRENVRELPRSARSLDKKQYRYNRNVPPPAPSARGTPDVFTIRINM